jgi:hypothetical protein
MSNHAHKLFKLSEPLIFDNMHENDLGFSL